MDTIPDNLIELRWTDPQPPRRRSLEALWWAEDIAMRLLPGRSANKAIRRARQRLESALW